MLVPIILGSDKDLSHGEKIYNYLQKFGVDSVIRICSAHKATLSIIDILNKYENNDNVIAIITCAGKSNALSGVVDSNFSRPVIACPPLKHESMYDIYSSTSMPSNVVPVLSLNPINAALAAIKMCAIRDENIRLKVKQLHINNSLKLNVLDIKSKYSKYNYSKLKNCISNTLKQFPYYEYIRSGKTRDLYTDNNYLYLVASDKLSAFDRHLTTIPDKGRILNQVSTWWLNKTRDLVPNHLLESGSNWIKVKKTSVIPIEFVVRSYMTGSTNTSIWKNYEKGVRQYCGHDLPDGLVKNQQLPTILLTPTTKDEHDELISKEEILQRGIMTEKEWNTCREYALKLFIFGQAVAEQNGLILVDTKYEFGKTPEGEIILIDELHTPDSSRYWVKHSYQERFDQGLEPENIDKEFIRKWVKKTYKDPYDESIDLKITDEMRLETSNRYHQLYELITGNELN